MNKSGFTLIELMIAVVIVSIIAAIAIPSYKSSAINARRADAQAMLQSCATVLERWYAENSSSYLGAVPGSATLTGCASQTPSDGSTKYYNITIPTLTRISYTLRATPITVQASDGFLELTHAGAKSWDKNNNGVATDTGENSWRQ